MLHGLREHEGPILTAANFVGTWPGLVGMLGLNGGLTKMNKPYSTVWTVDGTDQWFKNGIKQWVTDLQQRSESAAHAPHQPNPRWPRRRSCATSGRP